MIVFLHIPKTAGLTFQFILENSLGISACHTNHTKHDVFSQADLDFAQRFFPRLRSIAGHNLIDPLRLSLPNAFYMTFLREPVARVVSQYQAKVVYGNNRKTFEDTLKTDEMFENLHVKLMAGERNLDKAKRFLERCSCVGLTEKFDLSLHVLERLSPYRLNLAYKRRNTAPDNTIKTSVMNDERLKQMAADYNKLDMDLYAFAVSEIFPKLCARAGFQPTDRVPSYNRLPSELTWRRVLSRFYNHLLYRQICKVKSRHAASGSKSTPRPPVVMFGANRK